MRLLFWKGRKERLPTVVTAPLSRRLRGLRTAHHRITALLERPNVEPERRAQLKARLANIKAEIEAVTYMRERK